MLKTAASAFNCFEPAVLFIVYSVFLITIYSITNDNRKALYVCLQKMEFELQHLQTCQYAYIIKIKIIHCLQNSNTV